MESWGSLIKLSRNGKDADKDCTGSNDSAQIVDLLKRTQELEQHTHMLYAILLIVIGIAMWGASTAIGGSDIKDLFKGILLGVSIGEMLAGAYLLGRSIKGV